MAFADLNQLEILQGSLGLIWVIFASLIGLRIVYKAITLNRRDLIGVGITYILIVSAWWGVALQFISYGLFDIKLSEFTYIFVANVFIPIGLIFWSYAIFDIMDLKLKKKFFLISVIFCFIWEFYIIYFLFNDISMVAKLDSTFDSNHSPVHLIFVLTAIIFFVFTGVIFSVKSMNLEDKEVQWKGRFLLFAWILFTIGTLMDSIIALTAINLIIVRIILITGAILYYLGFFLPKSLSDRLIK